MSKPPERKEASDVEGRLSRLSLVNRPQVRELLETVLEESDEYSGTLDPEAGEEARTRNALLRRMLDFLLD